MAMATGFSSSEILIGALLFVMGKIPGIDIPGDNTHPVVRIDFFKNFRRPTKDFEHISYKG
jgi:hypothetical protein